MAITRRTFLKRAGASTIAAAGALGVSGRAMAAGVKGDEYASLIDLRRCDGCGGTDPPACVAACRTKNLKRFPRPEEPMRDYWPQKRHEDWSGQQELTGRLTPYNWTYVQRVTLQNRGVEREVFIPRRCMHCDHPACSALCPFGVNNKMPEGPVIIDTDICFGGAKCRDVCPWEIPQRQAGVGIYLKIAPTFAGGGVMYKCDLCYDRLQQGKGPACTQACPRGAISWGPRGEIMAMAAREREQEDVYFYGREENGGTSTLYVSDIPFTLIQEALMEQEVDGLAGKPGMPVGIPGNMDQVEAYTSSLLLAPLAGMIAAGLTIYKGMKGDQGHEGHEDSEA